SWSPVPTSTSAGVEAADGSEEEVALGHGEFGGGLLGPHLAVDADGEGVGVDLDAGHGVVAWHVGLAHLAGVLDRGQAAAHRDAVGDAVVRSGRGDGRP